MPLYPHFNENDKDKLLQFSKRKENREQKLMSYNLQAKGILSEMEDEDDLISDDEYAAVLNDEREIIVADTLYKYTYSGMFSVHKNEKHLLDNYIEDNDIEYLMPEPSSLIRGSIKATAKIIQSLPTERLIMEGNGCEFTGVPRDVTTFFQRESCSSGGGGSSSSSTNSVDHTQSLVNLIDDLEGCETLTGFLDGVFKVFGVSRKCYSSFSSKYRTKTKYWKENYLLWNSIGVKVKHQKRGWTGLWRAKDTDEIALSISQASFKFTLNIPNFPQSYGPQKLYFFEGKIFNSQKQIINYQNQYQKPPFPVVPFVSEVVVTEFIDDAFGYSLSVDKMRELFYKDVWKGAKSIVKSYKNRQPKNVTHIIYTPTTVYINYVDLDRRSLNTKKIVNRLDYNFGLGFKFNVNVDDQGHYSTNISNIGDVFGSIVIPKLYDYDDVKMDFVGASRKGNTWKGSRIIYTD